MIFRKNKTTRYFICLDAAQKVISEHDVYEEMIIELYLLHKMDNQADYFVTEHELINRNNEPYLNYINTYELDILGGYQTKQKVTA
tara:strand:+ start:1224 stop:1481 length:258 start_codon:yes stop_codon:yes gene_type:complete